MTACIQCSLRAMVAGEPAPYFDETPEEHMARVHPDLDATQRERRELEAAILMLDATSEVSRLQQQLARAWRCPTCGRRQWNATRPDCGGPGGRRHELVPMEPEPPPEPPA